VYPYCVHRVTPIRCASLKYADDAGPSRFTPAVHSIVQLLPCNRPTGSLESAPRTSLRADTEQETWAGFWSLTDDAYYTCCTDAAGREYWFRMADETPRDDSWDRPRARVIKFSSSRAAEDVVMMRLMTAQGRKPILVGASRRRSRPAGAAR
jgi:hypothetical protein